MQIHGFFIVPAFPANQSDFIPKINIRDIQPDDLDLPEALKQKKRAIIALSLRLVFVSSSAEQYDCNFPISSSVNPSFLCNRDCVNPFYAVGDLLRISRTRYNPSKNTFAEIRYLFLVDTLNVSQSCK